jgi:tetratricopeptide (TPR) repeat protein
MHRNEQMSEDKRSANSGDSVGQQDKSTDDASSFAIWYDKDTSGKGRVDSIVYFHQPDRCVECIGNASLPIFLVVDSRCATDLLARVHSLSQIDTILVSCRSSDEQRRCQYLLQHYPKIFDLFDKRNELLGTLQQLATLHRRQSGNDYLRLAESHREQQQYARALQWTQRALHAYRRTQPDDNHPLIARSLNLLGGIYDDQGDVNRSFEYYEQAVKIYARLQQSSSRPVIVDGKKKSTS